MSRRKQPRPRPVKALTDSEVCKSLTTCWSDANDNTRNKLSTETPAPRNKLSSETTAPRNKLSSETTAPRNKLSSETTAPRNKLSSETPAPRNKLSSETPAPRNKLSSETIAPSCNINHDSIVKLDCSSGADPKSPLLYKLQSSTLSQVAASSADVFMSFETTRWSQNVTDDQQAVSKSESNVDKCQICLSRLQQGSDLGSPVEGTDYFIDSDGTLSIRNGVCPRSLALSLFSEVFFQRSKYAQLLGENFLKFLMNLKQIVAKHKQLCPDENPYDFMKAENVLKNFSFTKKEFLELANRNNASELIDTLKLGEAKQLKAMEYTTVFPNTSFNSLDGISNRENLLHHIMSENDKKLINNLLESSSEHDLVCNPDFPVNNKSGISDSVSPKSSSRISSPCLSQCSVNSIPSMADKSKQVANNKRGCKILPVSSTDGQTHYPCPVCRLELSSDHELTVHIRSHNQSGQQSTTNTCTICGKTLSSQSSLDRHMLVHSGERPFKCKFCDMSFTTNGNMHRHARIHEKNGTATLKSSNRRYSENKRPSKEDLTFHEEKSLITKTHQSTSVLSEFVANKADLLNRQYEQRSPFLQTYYSCFFPYNASHHPAFPYQRLMQYPAQVAFPFLQTAFPLVGESVAECLQFAATDLLREPSPDLRAQQTLHCNVCEAVFTNPFSLESHMETHVIVDEKLEAESGSACKSCKAVAKSEASLLLHALKYHNEECAESILKSDVSDTTSQAMATPKSSSSSVLSYNINNNSLGFQNLGFVSFTSKKFPLIAQAFCESNPSTKALGLPVYKCQNCDLEFPVEGAKYLHEVSHVPEEYTVCPKCSCHFSEPSRLQEHMQKHVADLKFEESYGQKDPEPEKYMLQYHFLAQFGLIPKEEDSHGIKYSCDKNSIDIKDKLRTSDNKDENKMVQLANEEDNLQSKETNIETLFKEKKENCSEMDMADNATISNSKTLPLVPFRTPEKNELMKFSSPITSADGDTSQSLDDSPTSAQLVYPCKFCNLDLTSQKALKNHLYSHKNTPQFQCKVCRYSSTDKNTLLRHIRTHSGERPFKCAVCEYSFTTKANCERHLRHKHGLEKNQFSEKLVFNKCVIAKKKSSSGSGNNTHCGQKSSSLSPFCEFGFSGWQFTQQQKQQQQHLNCDFHLDYMCKLCKKTFPSHSSILKHIDGHHHETDQADVHRLIARVQNASVDLKAALACPPPAHIKPSMPSIVPVELPHFNAMTIQTDKAIRPDNFSRQFGVFLDHEDKMFKTITEKPLDFSKQCHYIADTQEEGNELVNKSLCLMDSSQEVVPIDLSVPRSQNSLLIKDQIQGADNQRCPDLFPVYDHVEKSVLPACHANDKTFAADIDEDDHMLNNKCHSAILESTALLEKTSQVIEDMDMLTEDKLTDDQKRCAKYKGSSSESNSSCELASVNKILDATDAQKFQNLLHVAETEDEQEMHISESASSDEDIIESIYSPLQETPSENHLLATSSEVTMDRKKTNTQSMTFTDANTMEEQADAELIEKVSQETSISPAKKKKNSYADSPHKFSCPYCTRCFPWLSSLNRHLLTHTGQKPFKCPRCPVTFSTKSNRERHLIRKHNVNMLDPASRSTMDRPYKCHVCMFSSFSTQNNLLKHYQDKHRHLAPIQGLGMDKTNEGEWEDSQFSSYEVDEEYNSVIEGKMSDKEIMYENYTQDSDSSNTSLYNLSNKGKTIFPLNCENHTNNNKIHGNSSYSDAFVDLPVSNQTQHPVNGQSLSSDNLDTDNHVRLHKDYFCSYPFKCSFCDNNSFSSRVECLQHLEKMHQEVWAVLKVNNEIGNIQVFSEKLDKMTSKLCKTEQDVNGMCKMVEQDYEEKIKAIHDTKLEKLGLKGNCLSRSSFDDLLDPEASEEITDEILLSEICCAMCLRRFESLRDLRKHMHLHTDIQKVHVGKLKISGNATLAYLPTSVISTATNSGSHYPETISEDGHGNNVDILHNLLGVESSTIDQIFECSDSAASLLGV